MTLYDISEMSYKNGYKDGFEDGKKEGKMEFLKMIGMTYCTNTDCPFEDCIKHWHQLKKVADVNEYANFADFGGVCRKYIGYLVEMLESEDAV